MRLLMLLALRAGPANVLVNYCTMKYGWERSSDGAASSSTHLQTSPERRSKSKFEFLLHQPTKKERSSDGAASSSTPLQTSSERRSKTKFEFDFLLHPPTKKRTPRPSPLRWDIPWDFDYFERLERECLMFDEKICNEMLKSKDFWEDVPTAGKPWVQPLCKDLPVNKPLVRQQGQSELRHDYYILALPCF